MEIKIIVFLFFRYGRAELKQSDHRPILGIIDVEVHKVDEEKREKVFQEALAELGKFPKIHMLPTVVLD